MIKTGYHYKDCDNDTYQTLHRPDGSEVLIITEPEDRAFGRDLSGVITELNRLHDDAARYRQALEEIKKGEGVFSMDRLQHAENTIDSMKEIASVALGDAGAGGGEAP